MCDYQNSKIYKIVCNITKKVYIGSTTSTISRRVNQHVHHYNSYLNGKTNYRSSFEIIKNRNYYYQLIENYPCDTKQQLLERESYYSNKINCVNIVKQQGLILKIGKKQYEKQYSINNKESKKLYDFLAYKRSKMLLNVSRGLDIIKKLDKIMLDK